MFLKEIYVIQKQKVKLYYPNILKNPSKFLDFSPDAIFKSDNGYFLK